MLRIWDRNRRWIAKDRPGFFEADIVFPEILLGLLFVLFKGQAHVTRDVGACLVLDPQAWITLTFVRHTFAVPVSADFLRIQEKREPVIRLPLVFVLGVDDEVAPQSPQLRLRRSCDGAILDLFQEVWCPCQVPQCVDEDAQGLIRRFRSCKHCRYIRVEHDRNGFLAESVRKPIGLCSAVVKVVVLSQFIRFSHGIIVLRLHSPHVLLGPPFGH